MKFASLNSKMLVNGVMLIAGLTAIVSGISSKCENHGGYQGGRNFVGTREEYRQEKNEEGKVIKEMHKYSSYTFAGLMGIHLLQHYKPIKNYLKRKKEK